MKRDRKKYQKIRSYVKRASPVTEELPRVARMSRDHRSDSENFNRRLLISFWTGGLIFSIIPIFHSAERHVASRSRRVFRFTSLDRNRTKTERGKKRLRKKKIEKMYGE